MAKYRFNQFYYAYSKDHSRYTYWHDDGTRVELIAGQDGVTEAWIAQLKRWHQEELNCMRHGKGKVMSLDDTVSRLADHSELLIDRDPSGCPDAALERGELRRSLNQGLALLDGDQRQLVVRHVLWGESFATIARKKERDESTVRYHLRRALRRLRECVE